MTSNIQNEQPGISRRRFVKTASAAAALLMPAVSSAMAAAPKAAPTITSWSALELSAAIKSKKVSCSEVMQAYLSHIEAVNPGFNAIVSMRPAAQLLAEAKQCDTELAAGQYRGWMHGFPHAVKDLADVKGLLTSLGSPIFKNNIASSDSIHVARMKHAGAIVIGKTNVPEFGLGSNTYNPVFGPTLNAYDGFSTAGGSSGGAAAALALQLVPVADGSDLMGSLRNPAGYNNVIGFRPTPGRVPLSNNFMEQLPCNGPMGRTVADTAMLLSTIAGYDSTAPTSLLQNTEQFSQPLQRDFKGVKIGWLGDYNGYLPMEKGVMELSTRALQSFLDIGCEVDEVTLDYSMAELWQTWLTFRHWLNCGKLQDLYQNPQQRALLKPEAIWEVEGGLKQTGLDIYRASNARAKWYQALLSAFESFDYLVLPTAQVFPFDANIHWPKQIAGKTMDTYHRWMEVVIGGTLSGCPVANVPAGFGDNKLPMGLQIIGPRHRDFAVLQLAHAYEQAAGWNLNVCPPVLKG
jgi:amidase